MLSQVILLFIGFKTLVYCN